MRAVLRKCSVMTIALLLGWSTLGHAEDFLKNVKDFELEDQHGIRHSLEDYAERDFVVIYIHGTGCPIARLSVPTYLEIEQDYSDRNIEFLMLNSFVQDDIPRIAQEAEEFNIGFPILKDADQSVARSMGVERTAEVFIVDPRTNKIHFRGPINDALGYETQRTRTSNHYLRDALETVMAGGTVNMNEIPDAKGCLVGYFLS
ncbi:hypothetical protein LCGC14_0024620 [marine sediment metagenome]|uniref:Thioredoxin domain-containing protein n=2 Tax=root TaxID=1 RepID=A0A0F9YFL8_9ZZZZ